MLRPASAESLARAITAAMSGPRRLTCPGRDRGLLSRTRGASRRSDRRARPGGQDHGDAHTGDPGRPDDWADSEGVPGGVVATATEQAHELDGIDRHLKDPQGGQPA